VVKAVPWLSQAETNIRATDWISNVDLPFTSERQVHSALINHLAMPVPAFAGTKMDLCTS
jgi:hypothetical protein